MALVLYHAEFFVCFSERCKDRMKTGCLLFTVYPHLCNFHKYYTEKYCRRTCRVCGECLYFHLRRIEDIEGGEKFFYIYIEKKYIYIYMYVYIYKGISKLNYYNPQVKYKSKLKESINKTTLVSCATSFV